MNDFLREVNEQGQALRKAAEAYRERGVSLLQQAARLAQGRPLVLTGMGSSWAAAIAVEAYLVREGRLAVAVDAGETLYRWIPVLNGSRGALPVLISQSGESREMVRLGMQLSTPFIAVTNDPESSLARQARVVLPLYAGEEKGVTNKTFMNTIAVMLILARTLLQKDTGERLSEMARLLEIAEFLEAAAAVDHILSRSQKEVEEVYRLFTASASGTPSEEDSERQALLSWELIGRGSGMAAVHQGALTLRELTGRVTVPGTGGFFRHGPVYRCGHWTRAIILAAREEEGHLFVQLARDILDRGGRVAFLSDFDPEIDSPLLRRVQIPAVARCLFSIPAMVPLELLGITEATARGLEPGAGVPKITPVE